MIARPPGDPTCPPRRRRGNAPHRVPSPDGRPSTATALIRAVSGGRNLRPLVHHRKSLPPVRTDRERGGLRRRTDPRGAAAEPNRSGGAVLRLEATVAGSSGKVLLGLAVEDGDHVLGWYDADSRRVGIDVRSGGRTRTIRRRKVDLPTSFRLGVALCENQLTVLADSGNGWKPLLTERNKVRALVDMRDSVRLGEHRYAYGYGQDSGPAPHRRAVGAVRDDRHPRPAPRPAQRRDAVRTGRQGVLHRHLRRPRVLPAGPLGRVHPRPGPAEAPGAGGPALLPARRSSSGRPRGPDRPRRRPGRVDRGQQLVGRLRLQGAARASPDHHRRHPQRGARPRDRSGRRCRPTRAAGIRA